MQNRASINCNGLSILVPLHLKTVIYKCRNLHLRLARTANHIAFLRRCRKHDVVPNGLKPKIANVPRKKILERQFGKTVVKDQLKELYRKKTEDLRNELAHRELLQRSLDQNTWTKIWIWILVCEKEVFTATRQKQCNKFERLLDAQCEETKKVNQETRRKVVNLTENELSDSEIKLLSKGLNFVPEQRAKLTTKVIANVQQTSRRMGDKGSVLIHETRKYLDNSQTVKCNNLTHSERNALRNLRDNEDIVITNSDKGNAVVVLRKGDYNSKMLDILNSDSYIKLLNDPTLSKEKELKKKLTKLKESGFMDQEALNKILKCNLKIPTIYGNPKLHKEGIPLRPVVCTLGSQSSGLAKFLCDIINPLAFPEGHMMLKNNREFVRIIRNVNVQPNDIMISLDVVNLFGSIPISECLNVVKNLLSEDLSLHVRTSLPIASIMELLTVSVNLTYFKFNNDYYEQVKGLAMGSPLSPTMANIYLNHLEGKMKNLKLYSYINLLKRYVDDYFALWSGSLNDLDSFTDEINVLDNSVKFTREVEVDAKLPFLDIMVTRCNNNLKTHMHEKEISSGIILNHDSDHHVSVKRNIIKNLKAKITECSDDVPNDLENLKTKLHNNNYPKKFVEKQFLAENPKTREPDDKNGNKKKKQRIVVPFQRKSGYKFKKQCEKLGVNVIFQKNKDIGSILGKRGKSDGKRTTNVIYKITCECKKFYIGETGRELDIRIGEHKMAIKAENTCYGIAKHVKETKHKIDFDNVEILGREGNETKRKIIEAFYIKQMKPELNLNTGVIINENWV